MKNKLKALALLLAFTLCFMGGFPPAYGAEAEKRIIRVAYPVQDGLTDMIIMATAVDTPTNI